MMSIVRHPVRLDERIVDAPDNEVQRVDTAAIIEVPVLPIAEMGAEQQHRIAFAPGGPEMVEALDLYANGKLAGGQTVQLVTAGPFEGDHAPLLKISIDEPLDLDRAFFIPKCKFQIGRGNIAMPAQQPAGGGAQQTAARQPHG